MPEPPARRESAARPVSVIVSTVVVRSGTANRLTVALRTPMANASIAMTASPENVLGFTSAAAATTRRRGAADLDPERSGDVLGVTIGSGRRQNAADG